MRNELVNSMLVAVTVFVILPAAMAQTDKQAGAAEAIPDLSGIWEPVRRVPLTVETALCGPANSDECIPDAVRTQLTQTPAQGVLLLTRPDLVRERPEEPQMQPWAAEKYKAAQGIHSNPRFNACMPQGPTNLGRVEIRQFPDVVLLLFDEDHWVRRIYMDGRGHPDDYPVTWMGHSIGKYAGDTLIIDTVKISEKSWIDNQGHPHSDALHILERIRRVDQNTLEMEFTIDDPKAYEKPWTRKVVYDLQTNGFPVFEAVLCEELLQLGTHYSAESKK